MPADAIAQHAGSAVGDVGRPDLAGVVGAQDRQVSADRLPDRRQLVGDVLSLPLRPAQSKASNAAGCAGFLQSSRRLAAPSRAVAIT